MQAGFGERALAAYQALIEVNCFLPPVYQTYRTLVGEPLAYFEHFWESSTPRIGEQGPFYPQSRISTRFETLWVGAVGFARWLELRTHNSTTPSYQGHHPALVPEGMAPLALLSSPWLSCRALIVTYPCGLGLAGITTWQKWLEVEQFRAQSHWLPWR